MIQMSNKDTILDLNQVSKSYGDNIAVDCVSFSVEPGEFIVVLGPSGCGKTTLLRLIAGLEVPNEGRVNTSGHSVGMVFQSLALFPHMTVAQNVMFGLSVSKYPQPEAERVLELTIKRVKLKGLEDRFVNQLSGGQQQRVAIARTLAVQPDILLMDEPLKSLDIHLQRELQNEIVQIHQQTGMTTVFVTHNQQEAFRMASRILIMRAGSIIQDAPPSEIYDTPIDAGVARFTGYENTIPCLRSADGLFICPLSEMVIPNPSNTKQDMVFCVRPEEIELSREAIKGALQVRVRSVRRHGKHMEYLVNARDFTLVAHLPVGDRIFQEGKLVYLRFKRTLIIPEAEG